MPWTGPWEACVSCTDVLVEASSYSSSSSRPALGSHVFAMSFTPLGAWVPSRIPDPAGSLSCPGPLVPSSSAPQALRPSALQGAFLHLQEWGLGSESCPGFGAEILGAEHLWVTPFLLQAGTGLLAFPAAGPSLPAPSAM